MQKKRAPIRLWFVMIQRPGGDWARVGRCYRDKSTAADRRPFVKKACNGLPTRVQSAVVRFDSSGEPTAASVRRLLERFNIDIGNAPKA